MASEQDLRDLFAAHDSPRNTIDTSKVISRSRGRRIPRQIAAGAVGALAVAGIVTVAVQTSQFTSPAMTASQGQPADMSPREADSPVQSFADQKRAPADKINLCEGSLAETSPSVYGLQLDVSFPSEAPVGSSPVNGTVTLTNTSDAQVSGFTAPAPAITLSQDGMVLWHSNGPTIMSVTVVDLAPGGSLQYDASFAPVRCEIADDLEPSFRSDLAPVPAGQYDLSAVIDFTAGDSMAQAETPELDLVSSPLAPIALG